MLSSLSSALERSRKMSSEDRSESSKSRIPMISKAEVSTDWRVIYQRPDLQRTWGSE